LGGEKTRREEEEKRKDRDARPTCTSR
jgi:hypothetical protein